MPSLLSHPAPALCLGLACGKQIVPLRLLAAGIAFSLLPDIDGIGFKLGVAYGDIFGHRGLTHSLIFALGAGLTGALAAPLLRSRRLTAFFVCGGAVLAHILLDAMTNGGLGVALFWPWDNTRYFLPWQPIEVSPLSPRRFFTQRGLTVLLSEARWVWLPCLAVMLPVYLYRKRTAGKTGRLGPATARKNSGSTE